MTAPEDTLMMLVIPVKTGIHFDYAAIKAEAKWSPAFAGVTNIEAGQRFSDDSVLRAKAGMTVAASLLLFTNP